MKIRVPTRVKRAAKILFSPVALPSWGRTDSQRESLLQRIKSAPTSGAAHRELGDYYAQRRMFIRAIAEYRTALAFEETSATTRSLADAYRAGGYSALTARAAASLLPPQPVTVTTTESEPIRPNDRAVLHSLDPARYQRLRATANRIEALHPDCPPRVLDVGGGDGALCLFLPEAEYVLAEPATNGLGGGTALPERSFDVVVACHVLEYVPVGARDRFLFELCRKCRGHVLILGPFEGDAAVDELAERLVYQITKADWAAEHLDCKLPTIDSVKAFAERAGLPITVTANGNAAAVFWMIFAMHFAGASGAGPELDCITRFFNAHMSDKMTNSLQANDFMVELSVRGTPLQDSKAQ